MTSKNTWRGAFRAAFPHTLPILAGFLFLGTSYGILMKVSGFSFVYPLMMSITSFGGSLDFVAASLLLGSFAPWETAVLTLMIQARHLFYGIAMLDRYRGTGWKKAYLIFGMCDESFSVNCTAEPPEGIDRGRFMFAVTLLNHLYWITGATLGGIIGGLVSFDTHGLEFVMTAMFVVIFLENWLKEKRHLPALIGMAVSVVCLVVFGADTFLLPTMAGILLLLTLLRRPIGKGGDVK